MTDELKSVRVYYKNSKGWYHIWTKSSNIIIVGKLWQDVITRAGKYLGLEGLPKTPPNKGSA